MTLTPAHFLRVGTLILGAGVAISIGWAPGAQGATPLLIAALAFAAIIGCGEWLARRPVSR